MYDLIVIGGGPGGYSAALAAAKAGKKVCLFEKENRLASPFPVAEEEVAVLSDSPCTGKQSLFVSAEEAGE